MVVYMDPLDSDDDGDQNGDDDNDGQSTRITRRMTSRIIGDVAADVMGALSSLCRSPICFAVLDFAFHKVLRLAVGEISDVPHLAVVPSFNSR